MMMERGSRRTRSQAAPDWSVQECLILVNEIHAIDSEWKHSLASFQKWQLVVQNCNSLDVNRSLNQCKSKWVSLLSDYRRVKPFESAFWAFDLHRRLELGLPGSFSAEIFQAIDNYFAVRGDDAAALLHAWGADSDPDTDPEPQGADDHRDLVLENGSKKQRKRSVPQKRKMEEELNPWRNVMGRKLKHEQHGLDERLEAAISRTAVKVMPDPGSIDDSLEERTELPNSCTIGKLKLEPEVEGEELSVAANLLENAKMINLILQGKLGEDLDYKVATHVDFMRLQGDQLIHHLGKFSNALDQLCNSF